MNNKIKIQDITKLRSILYDKAYNNLEFIKIFNKNLESKFECNIVNYKGQDNSISIRIKKALLKSEFKDYAHTSDFYYPIINSIFFRSLMEVGIMNIILQSNPEYNEFFSNLNCMSLLYNITVLDNSIIITL